jgi:hypothetical protein
MLSSKRRSKTATAAVLALLPSLLYSGLARATCVEELDKLKAAAATYKRITGGKAVLHDELRKLVNFSTVGVGFNFDRQACMKKKLTYPIPGGAPEAPCAHYQSAVALLDEWKTSARRTDIQKEAYRAYHNWNVTWYNTQVVCGWALYPDRDKISALKLKAKLVPGWGDDFLSGVP